MVKAKDFWECICNELNYRFFSGIPSEGLDPLYLKMDSKFMHYIPAISTHTAIGMANGAVIAGVKSAVFLDASKINNINIDFNIFNNIPLLIIASGEDDLWLDNGINIFKLGNDVTKCLRDVDEYISKGNIGILFIGKGELK